MSGLAETLSRLSAIRRTMSGTMPGAMSAMSGAMPAGVAKPSRLFDLTFGPNPGALAGRYFVPPDLSPGAPLVVVLHGCTQQAEGFDAASGWSRLAARAGFAVLYPQQRRENNNNLCFNWFSTGDISRDSGEARSIKAMIDTMIADHRLDPARVFITGLSAGGAMTGVMLATYPELFAGGAIIAGLPFGVAHSVPEAFETMRGQRIPPRAALGALVRDASPATAWPPVTIWHGGADATVVPANAEALLAQWCDVQNLPDAPTSSTTDGRQTRRVWTDAQGQTRVAAIIIAGMGHGVPLAVTAGGDETVGPFMLDVGASAMAYHALAWAIATPAQVNATAPHAAAARSATPPPTATASPSVATPSQANTSPKPARPFGFMPPRYGRGLATPRPAGSLDVGKIINDALRSAGLLR